MQDIENAIHTITVKAAEEADKFIFEVIKPYCDYVSKREITKKDLELALTQYFSKEPCETTTNNDEPIYINYPIITCNDVISIDDVIEWLKAKDIIKMNWQEEKARKELQALPPVEPSRKGRWIENDDWDGDVYYECSVCKEAFCMMDGTPVENMYYYCPHCGAAMAGEIERRDCDL